MQVSSPATTPYSPGTAASTTKASLTLKPDDPVEDFMAYARMTPAQKMRAAILDSMGLTEDQLAQMDPQARAKVEDKIKEMIKQKVEAGTEKQTGLAVDLKV